MMKEMSKTYFHPTVELIEALLPDILTASNGDDGGIGDLTPPDLV